MSFDCHRLRRLPHMQLSEIAHPESLAGDDPALPSFLCKPPRDPASHPAPGTRNQEPGTRNQEPGTRHQAPGTRHQAPGTRYQVPGPTYPALSAEPLTAVGALTPSHTGVAPVHPGRAPRRVVPAPVRSLARRSRLRERKQSAARQGSAPPADERAFSQHEALSGAGHRESRNNTEGARESARSASACRSARACSLPSLSECQCAVRRLQFPSGETTSASSSERRAKGDQRAGNARASPTIEVPESRQASPIGAEMPEAQRDAGSILPLSPAREPMADGRSRRSFSQ